MGEAPTAARVRRVDVRGPGGPTIAVPESALKEAPILIVDDERTNLVLLESILGSAGYTRVTTTDDPRDVPELIADGHFHLLVSDLHMPQMHGYDLIEQVLAGFSQDDWFPIAVITADTTPEAEQEALSRGAKDFINKPFRPTQIRLRVQNLVRTRLLHVALQEQNANLEERVMERTIELEGARLDLLERLALAAEFRDYTTGMHTQRVGLLASLLATRLGLPQVEVDLIRRAAPLHDVGKIGIPDHILLKPGRLSEKEFATMQNHVSVGAKLLSKSTSDLIKLAEKIALTHHERWDGTGYPRGLAGDAIPLVGQIVAVADVFDTLTNERPYKPAWPLEKALTEMRRQRGRWFSPLLVDAFLDVLDEHPELVRQYSGEAAGMVPPAFDGAID